MVRQVVLRASVGLLLVASACTGVGGPWSPTPPAPLDARAFAATACDEGRMLIWGGAQPRGMPRDELMPGAAIFDAEVATWTSIEDPPIALRQRAGAVHANNRYVVWGGHDGLAAAEDRSDFVYFSDGAVYSPEDGSWHEMAPSPLDPRYQPQVVATQQGVLVLGGKPRSGPPGGPARGAALYDVESSTWARIAEPDVGSMVVALDTVIAFGPTRVTGYDPNVDSWVERATNPPGLTLPDAAIALSNHDALVFQGARAWRFDAESQAFSELPPVPVSTVTYVGLSAAGVVVWDETLPAAASFDVEGGEWVEYEIPKQLTPREGTLACAGPTTLTVWGGWRIGFTFRIAEDTGFVLDLGSAAQE